MYDVGNRVAIIVAVTFIVIALGEGIWGVGGLIQDYQYNLDNPPSENYIEEDLEYSLVTLDVRVVEMEQDDNILLVRVAANGLIFRAEYKIELGWREWRLESVTLVGIESEEDRE